MENKLPARPNLEQLRSQAKTLLARLKEGDTEAAETFIRNLPAAHQMNPEQVRGANFRLADAQSAIARGSGFATWPSLARHVEQLRAFEGTWEITSLELDGAPAPVGSLEGSALLIDGDRFRMASPGAEYEGIFNIDVEAKPHHIDIEFVEGPEAGNWSYGIFELDGDDLRICLTMADAPRPTAFATSPDSNHAFETLRRASKARPEDVHGGTPPAPPKPASLDASDFESLVLPERFLGDWIPLEVVMNGRALPASMLSSGSRSASGNETRVVFGGQTMLHAKVRIDDSTSPWSIDYFHIGGAAKGKITHGILEWEGDEARICMAAPSQPRPDAFSCEAGSGRTLTRWKPAGG